MRCVFCEIAAGREPASFVWQDEQVLAFMALEQPTPGHVLVVPRAHVESVYDLEDDLAAAIFQATVRVASAVRTASGCPGLSLVQSNGAAAHQDVFHFHLHLLPRFANDHIKGHWPNVQPGPTELDRLAAGLRAAFKPPARRSDLL
jgi:histidine triad (HIT) family protein